MPLTIGLAALLALSAPTVPETVIYRCTGTDGSLALQSMPCPAGSKQQIRRISADYAPPQGTSSASMTTPPEPHAAPDNIPPRHAVRPLPLLHHCQSRRGAAYWTDNLEESIRCLPLSVHGLDGNPATGAGEACEIQRDQCEPVEAASACAGWQAFLEQSRQQFANRRLHDTQQEDRRSDGIAAVLTASACADALTPQKP